MNKIKERKGIVDWIYDVRLIWITMKRVLCVANGNLAHSYLLMNNILTSWELNLVENLEIPGILKLIKV